MALRGKHYGLYAGIMSGTSLDGIDVALVEFGARRKLHLRAFQTLGFDEAERKDLLELTSGRATAGALTLAHTRLGQRFGQALIETLDLAGINAAELKAVGSHGQTVWHHPPGAAGYGSMQLGAPAEIAARVPCPVAADFRAGDMAAGGQGGPLVPAFHRDFFGRKGRSVIVHNLGGIANLAYINGQGDCPLAFDTGPGNMLMDALMRLHYQKPFDAEGATAATGKISLELVDALLREPFFQTAPPKSTGREQFGDAYLQAFLKQCEARSLSPADQVATATVLTVRSMADAYRRFVLPLGRIDEVVLSGGGARNTFLRNCLADEMHGVRVTRVDDLGVSVDAVEAAAFAYLAYLRLAGLPGNVPKATGALRPVILGSLTAGTVA